MRKPLLLSLIVVVLAGVFVLDLLIDAGQFGAIEPLAPGPCRLVPELTGAEDITFYPETGVAFISAFDRRALLGGGFTRGAIHTYDLRALDP